MNRLGSLKTEIGQLLSEGNTCLWFSGGTDSRLLLEVMTETRKAFGILRFDDGWTPEQKRQVNAVALSHDQQFFSYPPGSILLIGDGSELSLAASYAVTNDGKSAVLVRDLCDGDKCAFDLMVEVMPRPAQIEFDTHIWGSRFDDTHYAVKEVLQSAKWSIGDKQFIAPLADWTREEVTEALKTYNVDLSGDIDTGNIYCCHNCLKGQGQVFCPKSGKQIDSVTWDRAANLRLLQQSLEQIK